MPDGGAGDVAGGNALRCSLRSANAFPPIQMAESAVVGVTSVMLAKRKRRYERNLRESRNKALRLVSSGVVMVTRK